MKTKVLNTAFIEGLSDSLLYWTLDNARKVLAEIRTRTRNATDDTNQLNAVIERCKFEIARRSGLNAALAENEVDVDNAIEVLKRASN